VDLVAPLRKTKRLMGYGESIILSPPPLTVRKVASDILLRCKIELMPVHIHYPLQTKYHPLLNLWAIRCRSWHGVKNSIKSHQSWPPNRVEHLLLGCWVEPRDRVNHINCCHPPRSRIVASVMDPCLTR
jgi:hypothetical protein